MPGASSTSPFAAFARVAALVQLPVGHALLLFLLASFFQRAGHDEQRGLQIVFLGGCALVLVLRRRLPLVPIPCAIGIPLGAFFLLGLLSGGAAFSPRFAVFEVATWLLTIGAALMIGGEIARQGEGGAARLLRSTALVCALYGLKVVAVYLSVFAVGAQPGAGDFTPGFHNFRFFNYAQTLLLPLLVAVHALAERGSSQRWLWLAVCSLWFALLLVTGARGTTLGLVMGCVAVAVIMRRDGGAFLKSVVQCALGGVLVYLVFFMLIPLSAGMAPFGDFASVGVRTALQPVSGRGPLWELASRLAAEHPWLGVGPAHFAHEAIVLQNAAHPHNWVLQVAAEWGTPALLVLCVVIVMALWALRDVLNLPKAADRESHVIGASLLAAGAAVLIDGLVSGNIVMPHSQLALCLYLGVASGWCCAMRAVGPVAGANSMQRAVVALALGGLMWGAWPELVRKLAQEPLTTQEAKANGGAAVCPRLWLHGYF